MVKIIEQLVPSDPQTPSCVPVATSRKRAFWNGHELSPVFCTVKLLTVTSPPELADNRSRSTSTFVVPGATELDTGIVGSRATLKAGATVSLGMNDAVTVFDEFMMTTQVVPLDELQPLQPPNVEPAAGSA